MKLEEMFLPSTEMASEFLASHTGRYFLFNIKRLGQTTAACLNIKKSGSGKCRFLGNSGAIATSSDEPGFELTSKTIYIPYTMLNMLGNYFEAIRCVMPSGVFNQQGRVSVGLLGRDSEMMGSLLGTLQEKTETICEIYVSLKTSIDTPIYSPRKGTKKPVKLAVESKLSISGQSLLEAYGESLPIYSCLPELCGFGNENTNRCEEEPNKRDARLRFWMQDQKKQENANPLHSKHGLNFIAHELKPLNIAGRNMKWNCEGNPRTDSIDLLLEHEGSPVVTEVKMAGDKFLSVAAVQLWYYAAVLASDSQSNRLVRWFNEFSGRGKPWLGLLAQTRDESKSNERGFSDDLESVLVFLRNSETKNVMGHRFAGAFVIIIEEIGDGFAISNESDFRIDWQG